MNEEEARKILKRIDIKFFLCGMNEQSNYIVDEANKVNNAIETVLNLLEKKDTLIHTMQSEFERLEDLEDNTDMLKIELEKKDIDIIEAKEANRQLSVELQKKDKIINELEDIFYNYQLCEYELTDCTYRKCEYIADDEIPPCKECIKQYFERKVENGN